MTVGATADDLTRRRRRVSLPLDLVVHGAVRVRGVVYVCVYVRGHGKAAFPENVAANVTDPANENVTVNGRRALGGCRPQHQRAPRRVVDR